MGSLHLVRLCPFLCTRRGKKSSLQYAVVLFGGAVVLVTADGFAGVRFLLRYPPYFFLTELTIESALFLPIQMKKTLPKTSRPLDSTSSVKILMIFSQLFSARKLCTHDRVRQ
uniref:Uncharacterized protein n=1 Tax=Palpitomonas bilix TaxID=652834 RepID=A0A7S3D0J6_9EUKA|mmetsp:Transcript_17103/g.42785  ORF Transcript_17103/g.42785 Transcript_17103/m.42785 type:complete len:113 (+) Transcript_17103:159-497(+)